MIVKKILTNLIDFGISIEYGRREMTVIKSIAISVNRNNKFIKKNWN